MKVNGNDIFINDSKITNYVSFEGQISNTYLFKSKYKIENIVTGAIEREDIESLEHAVFLAENSKK